MPFTFLLAACALLAAQWPAAAEAPWMSEEAMRADFVGETLEGYYWTGRPWTASYAGNGRYEVREGEKHAVGTWYFRGRAFCFHYGPPDWPLAERCGAVRKLSANCYQFHLVLPTASGGVLREGDFWPLVRWNSRGWRVREPSTCEERPVV
jgi:hypothetical protein